MRRYDLNLFIIYVSERKKKEREKIKKLLVVFRALRRIVKVRTVQHAAVKYERRMEANVQKVTDGFGGGQLASSATFGAHLQHGRTRTSSVKSCTYVRRSTAATPRETWRHKCTAGVLRELARSPVLHVRACMSPPTHKYSVATSGHACTLYVRDVQVTRCLPSSFFFSFRRRKWWSTMQLINADNSGNKVGNVYI